ncbi:MAG: hypothetical protein ABI977_07470 [Acidobacteriota bacterium]
MKRRPAFNFVIEELEPLSPVVRPMFGCHSVYVGEKIVLFLRDVNKKPMENGVWVATTPEEYASLSKEFASMTPFNKPEPGKSPWFLLAPNAPDFEEAALKACEMILNGDPRIGRVTKPTKINRKRRSE